MSATTDSRPSIDRLAMAMRPDDHDEQLGGLVALGEEHIAPAERAALGRTRRRR